MIVDWLTRSCLSNDVDLVIINVPILHVRKILVENKISNLLIRIN